MFVPRCERIFSSPAARKCCTARDNLPPLNADSPAYNHPSTNLKVNKYKQQVRRFYEVLWNAHDKEAIPTVLHQNCTFRGSLGQEKRGHQGFAEYVDMVHHALGEYRCTIEELVTEQTKVFTKMSFSGLHQDDFMGFGPTGKRVTWKGCALFTFDGELITDVWVLGDLKGLEKQLKENADSSDL